MLLEMHVKHARVARERAQSVFATARSFADGKQFDKALDLLAYNAGQFEGTAWYEKEGRKLYEDERAAIENYAKAWTAVKLGRGYVNSLVVAVLVTLGQVFTSSLAAFAFARPPPGSHLRHHHGGGRTSRLHRLRPGGRVRRRDRAQLLPG